jgi:hypothetical protein
MSVEITKDAAGKQLMERRIIQLGNLPDQAGIAAALRRAFAVRPVEARFDDDDDDCFAVLLKQIH